MRSMLRKLWFPAIVAIFCLGAAIPLGETVSLVLIAIGGAVALAGIIWIWRQRYRQA